jgi:tRNA A-37 threonylcarbamoyl transferase component Bud32
MPIGKFTGEIAKNFFSVEIRNQLENIDRLLASPATKRLSNGPDYVVKTPLRYADKYIDITIKVFKRQNRLKDWHDRRNKSKAERSFRAAEFLQAKQVGTPAPIAWLDRWENGRLLESYYLCIFEPAICFRDALVHIYRERYDNAPLMDLLQVVAPAIRAMHDAGFMHGDMGNQNILLPQDENGKWLQPQFIDLNRGKVSTGSISEEERAFDLARIALPGAYLKIFKTIYNHHEDFPTELDVLEQKQRTRFWRHRRSSKWRHPIRHWKNRHKKPSHPTYPPGQDIWLWDEKSAQPMITLGRKEKHLYRDWNYMFSMVWQGLCALPGIYTRYRKLLTHSYSHPIALTNRVGVALHPHSQYIETELKLLEQLGNPPVLIRFCHHETETDWNRSIALVEQLHNKGIQVMLAILQDRRALLEPESWRNFLNLIVHALGSKVSHIEITHASNRLKWGIWSNREYAQLLQPALDLKQLFPQIKITGPACIDFEYLPVVAALGALPKGAKLDALSHLLYVDRRGAPENKQGYFSTLEKSALLKALALWSPHTEEKVIISEVNWPVKYTGIWSPIGCPYETPKWRREQPGEEDADYANYMLRFLAITLCSGHVEQVFWWRLSAHGYGLVDDLDNFKPRPAFKALAFFLELIGNATFERKHSSSDEIYLLQFKRNNQQLLMAWCTSGKQSLPTELTINQGWDAYGNIISTTEISESPNYYLLKS